MKELIRKLTMTPHEWGLTVVRLGLAAVIFPHGAQKMFGWFGGHGFGGTMGYFTQQAGVPWLFALAAILIEAFGPLLLALGLLSRLSALGIGATIAVAMFVGGHVNNGFFANWEGTQKGEGIEYHLLILAASLAVTLRGGGALSLDRVIARRLSRAPAEPRQATDAQPALA